MNSENEPKKKRQTKEAEKLKKAAEKSEESKDIKKSPKKDLSQPIKKSTSPHIQRSLEFTKCVSTRREMKYIFICGGSISGIGKGVTVSSIGAILQLYGFSITSIKIDPYLNVDAGTMSPFEHGEVFVLDDGAEVDLDLGNYERYLNISLTNSHNITTGKIYSKVIEAERRGDYLGKTVQVVPHVTNAIMDWIQMTSEVCVEQSKRHNIADICLVEVGGTVGDLESGAYYEAIRQFVLKKGEDNCAIGYLSYVPNLHGELKSKPTQHGVKELRSLGLTPDFIVCRCEVEVTDEIKSKIASFTNVKKELVFSAQDVENTLFVPSLLEAQGMGEKLISKLVLTPKNDRSPKWDKLLESIKNINEKNDVVKIAIIGKYTGLLDSYLSVIKALEHAAINSNRKLQIIWIESSDLSDEKHSSWNELKKADGILVPGGFGQRGTHGKIKAIQYARENKVPYLGISVIEFCRNVLGIEDADHEEFNDTAVNKVIMFMPEISKTMKGGTMRLGARNTFIGDQNSLASKVYYGSDTVFERHRHRYEVNIAYRERIEEKGLIFSGEDGNKERMEITELNGHPFFFGTQFHPEFTSRPFKPNPSFYAFVLAASKQGDKIGEVSQFEKEYS